MLDTNQIKVFDGRAFDGLTKLKEVFLRRNTCIDEEFINPRQIASMPKTVSDKCGFADAYEQEQYEEVLNIDCGKVVYSTGYVIGGKGTERGQWPFLVALINLETNKFMCGGNLITTKHVLTAAHCIQNKNKPTAITPEELSLLIGRHNLASSAERGAQVRDVSTINVHPDWKISTIKWDADIALLSFIEPVTFSRYIQPVCLPDSWKVETVPVGTIVSHSIFYFILHSFYGGLSR